MEIFKIPVRKLKRSENSTKNSVYDAEICATTRKNEINVTDLIDRSVYSSFKWYDYLSGSFPVFVKKKMTT